MAQFFYASPIFIKALFYLLKPSGGHSQNKLLIGSALKIEDPIACLKSLGVNFFETKGVLSANLLSGTL